MTWSLYISIEPPRTVRGKVRARSNSAGQSHTDPENDDTETPPKSTQQKSSTSGSRDGGRERDPKCGPIHGFHSVDGCVRTR